MSERAYRRMGPGTFWIDLIYLMLRTYSIFRNLSFGPWPLWRRIPIRGSITTCCRLLVHLQHDGLW